MQILLGITGTDGSGKGTVVDYLVKHKGFTHYSARTLFIEGLTQQGRELTRANMRLIANEMREEHGDDFLVTYYLKKIEEEKAENVIIESIRALAEAKTLKVHGGILLAVDADQALRYERVQERRSESDRVTFEEFKAHEDLEINDPDPHGMQKQKVIDMADYTILNNDTHEALESAIEEVFVKMLSS